MLTLLLSGLLSASLTALPAAPPVDRFGTVPESPLAAAVLSAPVEQLSRPVEIRTRKLHIVRPDLMHYPLAYDVYC